MTVRASRRWVRWAALAGVAVIVVALGFRSPPPPSSTGQFFVAQPAPVPLDTPFDLGTADVDGDGNLDLFTANHNSRSAVLVGDGAGGFRDVLTTWHLGQDPTFPEIESREGRPKIDSRGVYVYWDDSQLVVETAGRGEPALTGTLRLLSAVKIRDREDVDVSVSETEEQGWPLSTVRFRAEAGADVSRFVVAVRFLGVPLEVDIDPDVPPEEIFVGHDKTPATANRFTTQLQDRHGHAWADYDGDGDLDLFITRGGLHGELSGFPRPVEDELFQRDGDSFQRVTDEAGIDKDACRGRATSWVDADGDGDLDLFVSCEGAANRLYLQGAPGRFTEDAEELGLESPSLAAYRWVDLDADGHIDLVGASDDAVLIFENDGDGFEPRSVADASEITQLLVADYESDGDLDLLAVSQRANRLLVGDGDDFRAVDPRTVDLPRRARAAAWIDVNNDGLVDLHAVPGGIYLQRPDGRFTDTGALHRETDIDMAEAWVAWPDLDTDGSRDAVIVTRGDKLSEPATAHLFMGRHPTNHWLEIQLLGTLENAQAIGANVVVTTGDLVQVSAVGLADTSRYSQGHYRLYFGLGDDARPESVTVTWPGGRRETLRNPDADRLLVIEHPDG